MPERPHPPAVVLRRTNRSLVVVVPLWIVGRQLVASGSLAAVPGSVVFAIGLTCACLFAEWLVLRIAARAASRGDPRGIERWIPALPFRERACRSRRPWLVMGVVALVVVAARDRVLGDTLSLEYELFHADTHSDRHVDTSTTSQSFDGEPPRFAGRETACTTTCSRRGPLCDAALAEIRCGDGGPTAVQIDVSISTTGDECSLLPWFHEGRIEYRARGSMQVRDHGTKSTTFDITGSVERSATGFHSCAAFDAAIGQVVGSDVAGALDDMLDDDD